MLGRLENAVQVMVPLGHFLSNIRHMQMIAEIKGHNIKLNKLTREDLALAKKFIDKAELGVSMNHGPTGYQYILGTEPILIFLNT